MLVLQRWICNERPFKSGWQPIEQEYVLAQSEDWILADIPAVKAGRFLDESSRYICTMITTEHDGDMSGWYHGDKDVFIDERGVVHLNVKELGELLNEMDEPGANTIIVHIGDVLGPWAFSGTAGELAAGLTVFSYVPAYVERGFIYLVSKADGQSFVEFKIIEPGERE